jgi:hypothetical protein
MKKPRRYKHKTKHKGKIFEANYSFYGKGRKIYMFPTTGTSRSSKPYPNWAAVYKEFVVIKGKS